MAQRKGWSLAAVIQIRRRRQVRSRSAGRPTAAGDPPPWAAVPVQHGAVHRTTHTWPSGVTVIPATGALRLATGGSGTPPVRLGRPRQPPRPSPHTPPAPGGPAGPPRPA